MLWLIMSACLSEPKVARPTVPRQCAAVPWPVPTHQFDPLPTDTKEQRERAEVMLIPVAAVMADVTTIGSYVRGLCPGIITPDGFDGLCQTDEFKVSGRFSMPDGRRTSMLADRVRFERLDERGETVEFVALDGTMALRPDLIAFDLRHAQDELRWLPCRYALRSEARRVNGEWTLTGEIHVDADWDGSHGWFRVGEPLPGSSRRPTSPPLRAEPGPSSPR